MISDDDLRRASQKWEEARLKQFPEPEACGFETTPKFERKMKKLIERTDHPTKYWLKKGLACFMLFFLLGGGLLSLNSEARAAFFGWTRKILGTVFEYRYTGEDASAPKNIVYLPSWIPDGFEIYRESYHEGAVMIDKRHDIFSAAIFVNWHSVMRGVENERGNLNARQKSLHGEKALKKTERIMAGRRVVECKNWQIVHGIGRSENVKVVTVVVAASMRVPTNIAIGLGVVAVAFAISDSKFSAIAQPFLSLLSGGNDGGSISGERQSSGVDESPLDRFRQELMIKHLEEEGEWLFQGGRFCLEL